MSKNGHGKKWESEIIEEMGYPEYSEMMTDVNHLYGIALNYPSDKKEVADEISSTGCKVQQHIKNVSLEILSLREAVRLACVNAMVGYCDPDVFIEGGREEIQTQLEKLKGDSK